MQCRALIVLAGSLIGLGACAAQSDATLADAQAAFEQHEYSKTRVILHSVLDRENDNQEARLLLVETLLELSDGYVAERYLTQIPATDLEPTRRLEMEARSLIAQGKPEAAVARFASIAERDAWTDQTYAIMLWAYQSAGALEDNEDQLAEAVNRFPDSADVHARAALHFKSLDEWDKVEKAVGFAIEADPTQFDARLLSGQLSIREGELEQALAQYSALAEDYPDFAVPIANVAGLQLDLDQIDAAEKTLNRALKRHPDFAFLQFQQARLHFKRGDYRKTVDVLQKNASQFRRLTPALILNAQVDLALGNREMARAQLATASRDPRFADEIEQIMQAAELTDL